jgi:dUTP pyrophosphatase
MTRGAAILNDGTMISPLRLFIAPTKPEFDTLYRDAADAYNRTPYSERNSGFDMFSDFYESRILDNGTRFVPQGCRALAVTAEGSPRAYWLAPRSSISKTQWRLANSMGLIDATYRGVVTAALDSRNPVTHVPDHQHTRLCQLAAADLKPWAEVIVVAELPGPSTLRGDGAFGSTGR